MALITTCGSGNANSFITAADASTRLATVPIDITAWTALSSTAKEQRLIYAAHVMDYLPWIGWRVYTDQALCWPRTCQDDPTDVPEGIKDAQAMIAYLIVHRGLVAMTLPSAGPSGGDATSVSIGGLNVGFGSGEPSLSGSSLNKFIKNNEFLIYARISRYLSVFRARGAGDRPDLLDAVELVTV